MTYPEIRLVRHPHETFWTVLKISMVIAACLAFWCVVSR